MELNGETFEITKDLVDVRISSKEGFVVGMEGNVFIILDTTLTPELINQGYVRELISKIQQLRKQADFEMIDEITISLSADEDIRAAASEAKDFIMDETIAVSMDISDRPESGSGIPEFDINGHKTGIAVARV